MKKYIKYNPINIKYNKSTKDMKILNGKDIHIFLPIHIYFFFEKWYLEESVEKYLKIFLCVTQISLK